MQVHSMNFSSPRLVLSICAALLLLFLSAPLAASPLQIQVFQIDESFAPTILPAVQQQVQEQFENPFSDEEADEKKAEDERSDDDEAEPEEEVVLPPPVRETISEKFVRFHMWDGSIVGGEIQQENITIQTENL